MPFKANPQVLANTPRHIVGDISHEILWMGQRNPAPVGGAKKITGPSTVALEHGPFMDDYDESSIIFNGGFPVC